MVKSNLRLVALLALILIGPILARPADTIPNQLSNDAFWHMIENFSEDGGYFRFQFMSNEREFTTVVPELKKTVTPGGVYFGVGPEQNFTYIAAVKPKLAFIFDIRRENMIEHLIYKSLFETSMNRVEFVSKLFSRKPVRLVNERSTVRALFDAFNDASPDRQLFAQNLKALKQQLTARRFQLSAKDLTDIDEIYAIVFENGPGSDYANGFGGFRGGGSNYAAMMTATDDHGQAWSYLATEENFQYVRDMERRNLIVPLVGDFAGKKALRAAGDYVREHDAAVAMFYTSNVEQYLFQQSDDWRKFYANASTLPVNAAGVFLRSSHYLYDPPARRVRQFAGTNYVMLRCGIADLAKAFNSGSVRDYEDVIRMSRAPLQK